MAEIKTKANDASVDKFLESIADESVRQDCRTICGIMKAVTKSKPRMWGTNIVGFGDHHYLSSSGARVDWMQTAFSPRKKYLAVYVMDGLGRHAELVERLGTVTHGKACLNIKRLSDIHLPTLRKLIEASVRNLQKTNGGINDSCQ